MEIKSFLDFTAFMDFYSFQTTKCLTGLEMLGKVGQACKVVLGDAQDKLMTSLNDFGVECLGDMVCSNQLDTIMSNVQTAYYHMEVLGL